MDSCILFHRLLDALWTHTALTVMLLLALSGVCFFVTLSTWMFQHNLVHTGTRYTGILSCYMDVDIHYEARERDFEHLHLDENIFVSNCLAL
jgi:hypothetical protein